MERSARGIDESRDFFLAEDRWEAVGLFRIGSLGDAPGLLESFDVEEPQRRQAVRNCTRRQLPLLKQLGLIFANVSRAQAIRRKVESSSKIFHCADVVACGMLRVITTLEFLQHHFSEMGHRDLLVTQNLSQPSSNTAPFTSRAASAAGRLRSYGQAFLNPESGEERVADDSGVEGQLVVQSPCLPRKWYHLQSPSSTGQK